MSAASALERLLKREHTIVLAGLALLCALAWLYLLTGAGLGMSAWEMTTLSLFPHLEAADMIPDMPGMGTGGMGAGGAPMTPAPWAFATWALMIAMWWTMMIAMMAPSAAPTILLYARVNRHAPAQGRDKLAPTGAFAAGYLLVWLGFSVAAAALHWGLERAGLVSAMLMGSQSRWLSSAVLIGAGLYQLSPLKHACLSHCRAPASFLARHWRPHVSGALRLGALARGLLRGLLLDADGTLVCRRGDEPRLDRRARRAGADREGAAGGPMGRPSRGRRTDLLGDRHAPGVRLPPRIGAVRPKP